MMPDVLAELAVLTFVLLYEADKMIFPIKEVLNNAGHSSKDYYFNYRQVSLYAISF